MFIRGVNVFCDPYSDRCRSKYIREGDLCVDQWGVVAQQIHSIGIIERGVTNIEILQDRRDLCGEYGPRSVVDEQKSVVSQLS
jgi:hypothetical protein